MRKIGKYFRGVGEEARRIRWPDAKTLWKSVGIVLVISLVAALTIVLSDFLASEIMKAFEYAFPSDSSESTTEAVEMIINATMWLK